MAGLDFTGNMNYQQLQHIDAGAALQNTLRDMVDDRTKSAERAAKLAQQKKENTRADANLLLNQAQGQRAEDAVTKSNLEDQALQEYSSALGAMSKDVIPEVQAQELLKQYNANPSATDALMTSYNKDIADYNQSPGQQLSILNQVAIPEGAYDPTKLLSAKDRAIKPILDEQSAIAAAKVKEADRAQQLKDQFALANYKQSLKPGVSQTGTITVGKDGKYTNIPIGLLEQFTTKGYEIGKPFKDSESSSSSSKKATSVKAYNDLYKLTDEHSASILGVSLSDDSSVGKKTLQMMESAGIDSNIAARAMQTVTGKGGDQEFSIDTLNDPEVMPPVYDPQTGNSMPFGTALKNAYDNDLIITVDDKGRNIVIPKPKQEVATSILPKAKSGGEVTALPNIAQEVPPIEYTTNALGERIPAPDSILGINKDKVKPENTQLFKELKRQYPTLNNDRLLERYKSLQ